MAAAPELDEILALEKEILAPEGDEEAKLVKVEEYAQRFDKWYDSFQATQSKAISAPHKPELIELAQVHAEVLEVASRLKGETFAKLQELKRKGKGIRAYAKNMPGSDLGNRPVRKG